MTILLLIEAQKLSSFFAFLHEDVRGKLPKLGVLLLLILGIIGNSVTFYRIKPEDHIARFVDYGEGLTTLQETAAGMMSAFYQNQEEFSRYAHEPMPVRNDTLNHDVHSIDYYWSLSNGAITQYFDELALPIEERAFKYNRLDYRSSLHALAGVEYYVRHDPSDYLPYLYSETNMHEFYGDLYYVSGTEEYLPFGYTYDHFISRETYEALPYIQRQQALLQGAVCERQTTNLTEADLRFEEQSVPSEISHEINIIETEDSYYAAEGGAQLTFTFEGLEGCETYLLIEGLEARSMTDIDFLEHEQLSFLFQEDWDELSTYEKRQKRTEDALDLFNTGASTFSFTCASSILETDFSYYTELTESAFDRSDYLINMGYSDTAQTAITLTLPYAGMYSFENLEVLCLPVETLPRHLDALQESVLEQVTFQTNQVTGTISLEKSKFLCLSVPYSSGWSAYVDGNQMPLYQANTMFMGLELDEGEHTIELRYQTPGLQTGLCISTTGFAAWLLYGLSNHTRIIRKRKRTKA